MSTQFRNSISITQRTDPCRGAIVALLRGAEDGVCCVVGEFIFGAQSLRKCVFVQLAIEHGSKSLRKGADCMQKQTEGRRRALRGCPGGTRDRPKGMLGAPRTAKKACWRHPGVTSEMTEAPKPQKRFSCQLRTHFGLRFELRFCAESMFSTIF